jgi:hypothetical protein
MASIRADVHALTNAVVQATAEIEASGKPRR